MRLLIVEDSARLRKSLTIGLTQLGHIIDETGDGREGLHFLLTNEYDVAILDLMLPSMDGLAILKEIRNRQVDTNVLILSARSDIDDRVKGLEMGADDYLCKPFAFDELKARLDTLERRKYIQKSTQLELENLTLDLSLRSVKVDSKLLALTPTEYTIFEQLLLNKGKVISYQQMIDKLCNLSNIISRNGLEAHVCSLRKKLRLANVTIEINTKRSFGYYLE